MQLATQACSLFSSNYMPKWLSCLGTWEVSRGKCAAGASKWKYSRRTLLLPHTCPDRQSRVIVFCWFKFSIDTFHTLRSLPVARPLWPSVGDLYFSSLLDFCISKIVYISDDWRYLVGRVLSNFPIEYNAYEVQVLTRFSSFFSAS